MDHKLLNIALADDDEDDRLLFQVAIDEMAIKTALVLFNNGKELMDYLGSSPEVLPQLVFLDLNMPIKNGIQCLKEIRQDPSLDQLIVAIYSTSSTEKDIEQTFVNGANIYIHKPNTFSKLKCAIERVLQLNWQYHTSNLNKENFLLRI